LTPWPVIEKRIESAAQGDFVISFYNPASGRRQRQIVEAQRIIKKYRSGQTPVGLVKSGYRKRQNVVISDLDHFLDYEIGMLTTVIVGSSQTEIFEGQMFTPRGYKNKYDIESGEIRPGQRKTFSLRCEGDMNSRLKDLSSDDGETIKLAKTYTTPTDSWVTPKDKKSKDFLNEEKPEINLSKKSEDPIQGALNALEILKRKNFYQSTSKEPSKNRREENLKDLSFFKEEKDYCKIGRLGGALLVNIREKYFLVGEFKEPCLLNDHGFKEIEQKNETHVYNIELLDKIKNPEIEYSFISAELKENLLLDLSLKWIIKRNGSVSERLTGLIKDHSSSVIYKKKKYIDITWLAQMPTSVWGIVRENILKC
jgi:precorrin-3B C17-methyltransferase